MTSPSHTATSRRPKPRRAEPAIQTPDVTEIVRKVIAEMRGEHAREMDDMRRQFEEVLEGVADERSRLEDLLEDYRDALAQARGGAVQVNGADGR